MARGIAGMSCSAKDHCDPHYNCFQFLLPVYRYWVICEKWEARYYARLRGNRLARRILFLLVLRVSADFALARYRGVSADLNTNRGEDR